MRNMKCPKCGYDGCQIISETQTKGKDYSVGKGCCGALFLQSWFGLLCGFCGEGKKTTTRNFWICHNCGHKFKA